MLKILEEFVVLNGRTNDDTSGDFTFINTLRSIVIDYCCCNFSIFNIIRSFEIQEQIWSEQLPIVLQIQDTESKIIKIENEVLTKFIWKSNLVERYHDILNNELLGLKTTFRDGNCVDENNKHLISSIGGCKKDRLYYI